MSSSSATALMYCQSLLGIGHLVRFLNIARRIRGTVVIVYGGEVPRALTIPRNVVLVEQEPVRADAKFERIFSVKDPSTPLAEIQDSRRHVVEDAYERYRPQALVLDT